MGRQLSRREALIGGVAAASGLGGAVLLGCSDDEAEPRAATSSVSSPTPLAPTTVAANATPSRIQRGGVYRSATAGDPLTLNPPSRGDFAAGLVGSFVYNRLFKRQTFAGSSGGETLPGPDAARSAETDDGVTWIVRLRDLALHDVAPVNGRQLDAEDVLFSVGLVQAEESPTRASFVNWLRVEVINAETLRFTLDAPSPTFLEQIVDLFVMPKEADGGFDPATTMIGGGPWILDEYRPSVSLAFDRHPRYYEVGEDGASIPYVDRYEWLIIPEYANRIAQFRAGNLTHMNVNANDVIGLRNDEPSLQWIGEPSRLLSILYWDHLLTTAEPYGDARFRQAVSMSLDRDALTELAYNPSALRDAGLPASLAWNNIIPAGWGDRWWLDPQSDAHGKSGEYFAFDPVAAKKLLSALGVEEGFKLPYIYTSRYGTQFAVIAEAQVEMLRAAGLDPRTDVQDYRTLYLTQTWEGNFSGVAFGYETPFAEAGSYWTRLFGDDPRNHSQVVTPELTKIAERQRVELDEDARRALMHEGQRLNAEQMYYVPSQAGAGTSWRAYQSYVRGGLRSTSGYGRPSEEYPWYWLDV